MKMKNACHKYNINRPRSRHGHNCNKVKSVSVSQCFYVLSNT